MGVEPGEAAIGGDIDALFLLELLPGTVKAVLEQVSQRGNLEARPAVEVVHHRAAAPAATANEARLEDPPFRRAGRAEHFPNRRLSLDRARGCH